MVGAGAGVKCFTYNNMTYRGQEKAFTVERRATLPLYRLRDDPEVIEEHLFVHPSAGRQREDTSFCCRRYSRRGQLSEEASAVEEAGRILIVWLDADNMVNLLKHREET